MGLRLHRFSLEGKWGEMAKEITDEILHEFAIVATYDELVPKIKERYADVVSTLNLCLNVEGPEYQERLSWLVQEIKKL